jgi:hypothetical protein
VLQTLGLLSICLRFGIVRAVRTPSAEGELIVKLFGQASRRRHQDVRIGWQFAFDNLILVGSTANLSLGRRSG